MAAASEIAREARQSRSPVAAPGQRPDGGWCAPNGKKGRKITCRWLGTAARAPGGRGESMSGATKRCDPAIGPAKKIWPRRAMRTLRHRDYRRNLGATSSARADRRRSRERQRRRQRSGVAQEISAASGMPCMRTSDEDSLTTASKALATPVLSDARRLQSRCLHDRRKPAEEASRTLPARRTAPSCAARMAESMIGAEQSAAPKASRSSTAYDHEHGRRVIWYCQWW